MKQKIENNKNNENHENSFWRLHGLSLFFSGHNNDEKNIKQIKCFIEALALNHENVHFLEQPKKEKILNLTDFFEKIFNDAWIKLKNNECTTYLFRLDPIGITIKETLDKSKEEQIKEAHAVIIHMHKKKKEAENGEKAKEILHIYLDDSMESMQFKLLSRLFLNMLINNDNYQFSCKNFGDFYSYQIFHGSSNSHFSLLYLLELWTNKFEQMRQHLSTTPMPQTMLFCDVFLKLKAFATTSKDPQVIALVNDYNRELEEIKFDKIRTIILQNPDCNEHFQKIDNDLIKKVVEYSKQKKDQVKFDSPEAKKNLERIPKEIDRISLEICMKNYQEIRVVMSLEIPEKITHLKTFQKLLDKIKENCEPRFEGLSNTF